MYNVWLAQAGVALNNWLRRAVGVSAHEGSHGAKIVAAASACAAVAPALYTGMA